MTIDINFAVILLGHILADFYFQTDLIALNKNQSGNLKIFIVHIVEYSICMGIILFLGIEFSKNLGIIWLASSFIHFIVDLFKRLINRYKTCHKVRFYFDNHGIIIDQAIHICTLVLIWYLWGRSINVRHLILQNIEYLPVRPIPLLVGFLCILRPVGIIIKKGELWDFSKHNIQPETSVQNAGKMIGYLERIIVLFFIIYQQYGAIAFVLTAKSVARFKEIETNKSMAEYYLIGTLLSIVSVFFIALVLGLCR